MTDAAPSDRDFLEYVLEQSKFEHDQWSGSWKDLDSKALGTATIGGVFLAASFAFVREASVTQPEQLFLGIAFGFLFITTTLAVSSMLVRTVSVPLTGEQLAGMLTDFQNRQSEATGRYDLMIRDTLASFKTANRDLRERIGVKAARLARAQQFLIVSASAVIIITTLKLFGAV